MTASRVFPNTEPLLRPRQRLSTRSKQCLLRESGRMCAEGTLDELVKQRVGEVIKMGVGCYYNSMPLLPRKFLTNQ